MIKYYNLIIWFYLFGLPSGQAVSLMDFGTPMKFHGRIFEPGCEFNSGNIIDIDFDKVGIKKVDGTKYEKKITVTMYCKKSIGKNLMLQLQASSINGKENVVPTDAANLGIEFKNANGTPIKLNQFFSTTNDTSFSFSVVPVKIDLSQPLDAGQFTATATLVSAYF